MKRRSRLGLAAMSLGWAAACVAASWDLAGLESRHPALAAVADHHLGDVTPYLLPASGEVSFFLCRWPTTAPIPVRFPDDATAEEAEALQRVLDAWEGAGLGVRFERRANAASGIEIRFIEADPAAMVTDYAANTTADCAVEPGGPETAPEAVRARLVHASIWMWRGGFDDVGRPTEHTRAELIGSALHELGHALGFQGHVRVGGSVMVVNKDTVRRVGRRVDRGEPLDAPTLRALYALPSGTVIHRIAVGRDRTRIVDRLAELARARAWPGPFVRVGDIDGFVFWRDDAGAVLRLRVPRVRRALRDAASFEVRSTPRVDALLDPSG